MLILHCVLQCFMLFSESVRSAKVSMSARINLTFVRAEKMINLHLPWMAKNVCNILTIGIAVS